MDCISKCVIDLYHPVDQKSEWCQEYRKDKHEHNSIMRAHPDPPDSTLVMASADHGEHNCVQGDAEEGHDGC